jgi:NTP pyrophosphatase (non-canonical NTP hydrolase)
VPDTAQDRLEQLLVELRAFVRDREWEQFHDPKNLAMAVASEAGELLAEYRWVSNTDSDSYSTDVEARHRIAAEIGDVGIALLLLSDRIGLDLLDVIRGKLALNGEKYPINLSRGRSGPPDRSTKVAL